MEQPEVPSFGDCSHVRLGVEVLPKLPMTLSEWFKDVYGMDSKKYASSIADENRQMLKVAMRKHRKEVGHSRSRRLKAKKLAKQLEGQRQLEFEPVEPQPQLENML